MTVETFYVKGWEEAEAGLVISENADWVLVRHIPVDYMVDGFRLYNKDLLVKRERKSNEKQIEKVLTLKQITTETPDGFEFDTTEEILRWCEKKYGLFEFQEEEEGELFYGKIREIENDFLLIHMIMDDGTVESDDQEYRLSEIRTISFETDYFKSIRLLWLDANRLINN